MASLSALPNELLTRIFRLLSKAELAALRLVNRHLNPIAAATLFEEITLYAHWHNEHGTFYPESWFLSSIDDYDAQVFKNVLDHKLLREHPRRVTIYTCGKQCDHNPDAFNGKVTPAKFDPAWEDCFDRICEFPNVREVTLCFDRHAGEDRAHAEVLMGPSERHKYITRLLRSLQDRIKELSIRNYNGRIFIRNEAGNDDSSSQEVSTLPIDTLNNLTSLRLSVIHDETFGSKSRLRNGDPHTFWSKFPETFLKHMEPNLKHLTLYSDTPLGWFPKLDLRNIHFPRLKSLAFGQFIFSHDWQVHWIISHQATLEELYLDHCSILYMKAFAIEDWLDEEGYPRFDPTKIGEDHEGQGWGMSIDSMDPIIEFEEFQQHLQIVPYDTRWCDIFADFSESLTKLRVFRFGTSEQWGFGSRSHFTGRQEHIDLRPLPVMPWRDERNMVNRLFHERYLLYDDWVQSYSADFESDSQYPDYWEDSQWEQMERPDAEADAEDERAFRALLKKLPNHFSSTSKADVYTLDEDVLDSL